MDLQHQEHRVNFQTYVEQQVNATMYLKFLIFCGRNQMFMNTEASFLKLCLLNSTNLFLSELDINYIYKLSNQIW